MAAAHCRSSPHHGPGSGRGPAPFSSATKTQPSRPMSSKTESVTDNPTAELKSLLREAEKALGSGGGEPGEKFDELRERLRAALVGTTLEVSADRFAQHVVVEGGDPSDSWFHLPPGRVRRIDLHGEPKVEVRALNTPEVVRP